MKALTHIIRQGVPRSIRNTLRRPTVTMARCVAKLKFLVGCVSSVRLTHQIEVNCHPICQDEFSVFTQDNEQLCEMSSFVDLLKPGYSLLDIGAHWGAFTLVALKNAGPFSRAICIEASAPVARVLRENLRLNDLLPQTVVINAACGSYAGTLQMLTTGAGGADYFVVPSENRSDVINVPQVTADAVCEEHRLVPNVIKIDVEGFEEEVIRGAMGLLRSKSAIVFLELHGDLIIARSKDPKSVLDLLANAGYSSWRNVNDGRVLTNSDFVSRGYNVRMFCTPG